MFFECQIIWKHSFVGFWLNFCLQVGSGRISKGDSVWPFPSSSAWTPCQILERIQTWCVINVLSSLASIFHRPNPTQTSCFLMGFLSYVIHMRYLIPLHLIIGNLIFDYICNKIEKLNGELIPQWFMISNVSLLFAILEHIQLKIWHC